MTKIWYKVLVSLTRGTDMRLVLIQASGLALLACLFTLPHFYHLIFGVTGRVSQVGYSNPWVLLFTQLFLLLIVSLSSATVGLSFLKKFDLPEIWNWNTFAHSIPLLLFLGAVMAFLSYFLFDRYFVEISPDSYPRGALYLISFHFKNAFTDEIILRLCFLTICIGLLKNRIAAVILLSIIASLFSIKYFNFMGIEFTRVFIPHFALSFIGNLILGYVFVTRGLFCSMFLKLIYSTKYVIVALSI